MQFIRIFSGILVVLAFLGPTKSACAQVVQLVVDINGAPANTDSGKPVRVGNKSFFAATTEKGRELWILPDGASVPVMVADIYPGKEGSSPSSLTVVGSELYFLADDGVHGRELWRSDGSPGGTGLVGEIIAGPDSAMSFDEVLVALPHRLIFSARGWDSPAIFAVDSDSHQIQHLADGFLRAGIALGNVAVLNFTGDAASTELWRSDGTAAETARISDINPGALPSVVSNLTQFGARIFFTVQAPAVGEELWSTDGTSAGTALVKDINPSGNSSPRGLTVIGNSLLFSASDGVSGAELWRTDGTANGTVLVKDIIAGGTSGVNAILSEAGGRLYFRAAGRLWQSDGTVNGTVKVLGVNDTNDGVRSAVTVATVPDGVAVLSSGLSVTDNIPSLSFQASGARGITRVMSLDQFGLSIDSGAVTAAGRTFLRLQTLEGANLLVTDGTQVGTRIVSPATTLTAASNPDPIGQVGGKALFLATSPDLGRELWISDGTQSGTTPLKDINPGRSSLTILKTFGNLGERVLFTVTNPGVRGLWSTDGTTANTRLVLPDSTLHIEDGVIWNSQLYVFGWDDEDISGLYRVDPGSGQATLVSTISPDGYTSISDFVAGDNQIFFFADDGEHGFEPWRSDGTTQGTFLLSDVVPGDDGPLYDNVTAVNNNFFFSQETDEGVALISSDGTHSGTRTVATYDQNEFIMIQPSDQGLFVLTSRNGSELTLFRDNNSQSVSICSNCGISSVEKISRLNGRLLALMTFDAFGSGIGAIELDSPRLVPLIDRSLGFLFSGTEFSPVAGGAVFNAVDPQAGAELWFTDGTGMGTRLLADLRLGIDGSNPDNFIALNGRTLFSADGGELGNELYVVQAEGDFCPDDPSKLEAGICGCGKSDFDLNANGVIDCVEIEILATPRKPKVRIDKRGRVRLTLQSYAGAKFEITIQSSKRRAKPIIKHTSQAYLTLKGLKAGRYTASYRYQLANPVRSSPVSPAARFNKPAKSK